MGGGQGPHLLHEQDFLEGLGAEILFLGLPVIARPLDTVSNAHPRPDLGHLEHLECSHQPHIQGRGAEKRTQRAG